MKTAAFAAAGLMLGFILAGCAAPQQQDFAVTASATASPPGTQFRSNDPNANDVLAKGVCADGYQKLDESTQPTDSGDLTEWHVRCTPYAAILPF
jgi:hypothetical protein